MKSNQIKFVRCTEFQSCNVNTEDLPNPIPRESILEYKTNEIKNRSNEIQLNVEHNIGIDWLVLNQSVLAVLPKWNDNQYVDYFKMLMEILEESTISDQYINDMICIDFTKNYIPLDNDSDILSPFLIATFLKKVRQLVVKGLRYGYYDTEENLQSKIKGKILFPQQLRKNILTGNRTNHYCRHSNFGVDIPENRLLKKTLLFVKHVMDQHEGHPNMSILLEWYHFIMPAFAGVSSDIDWQLFNDITPTLLFPEYIDILNYAKLLLKRFSFNISKQEEGSIPTPPFAINTDLLFELYVLKELKKVFNNGLLEYQPEVELDYFLYLDKEHPKMRHQRLDFLIKDKDNEYINYIIDAKNRFYYANKKDEYEYIGLNDIRQLSGYTRLTGILEKFKRANNPQPDSSSIDCIIIYPDLDSNISSLDFLKDKNSLNKYIIKGFERFYKIGLKLPLIKDKKRIY